MGKEQKVDVKYCKSKVGSDDIQEEEEEEEKVASKFYKSKVAGDAFKAKKKEKEDKIDAIPNLQPTLQTPTITRRRGVDRIRGHCACTPGTDLVLEQLQTTTIFVTSKPITTHQTNRPPRTVAATTNRSPRWLARSQLLTPSW